MRPPAGNARADRGSIGSLAHQDLPSSTHQQQGLPLLVLIGTNGIERLVTASQQAAAFSDGYYPFRGRLRRIRAE
jgi:hypothetical protein